MSLEELEGRVQVLEEWRASLEKEEAEKSAIDGVLTVTRFKSELEGSLYSPEKRAAILLHDSSLRSTLRFSDALLGRAVTTLKDMLKASRESMDPAKVSSVEALISEVLAFRTRVR